jgi:S-DNA-T family DNA segregation ATPase FtsK/SpoIIIE
MARRKKRWWLPNINTKSLQSILALVFILLGLLFSVTYIAALFNINNSLQDFAQFTFGLSSVLLPIDLILLGLTLTNIKHPIAQPQGFWGGLIITFSVTTFLGIFSSRVGGYAGSIVATQLAHIITELGVAFLSLFLFIIGFLMAFNTSLQEIGQLTNQLWNFLQQAYQKTISSGLLKNAKLNDPSTNIAVGQDNTQPKYMTHLDEPVGDTIEIVDDEPSKEPLRPPTSIDPGSTGLPGHEGGLPELAYTAPNFNLLSNATEIATDQSNIEKNANIIERTLQNFGIQARIVEVNTGPAVTQFAIDLAEGTKTSKITGLQNELALALASPTGSVRIESPIPGKRLIGIEVPNASLAVVCLKEILESAEMRAASPLAVALGKDVSGKPSIASVDKQPHMLVAGQTGSGKSVLLHSIIASILFRAKPTEVSFVLVDPKRVELTQYNGIPHLQTPVIVDPDKTVSAFKWAVEEMEKRYRLFEQVSARSLQDFNQKTDTEKLPYIVIIVDELADLMSYAANEMETLITRIAQKARATGIHMILATQRPSVNVITGLIKANIPSRIALNVTSGTDSRVIIDTVGAEKLLGRGDMLYLPPDMGKPKRIQGVFLSDEEIQKLVEYLKQFPSPYMAKKVETPAAPTMVTEMTDNPIEASFESSITDQPDDGKFLEAVEVILNYDKASASLLQRRLKVGYARAARLLDELEEKNLVAPKDGSNPRDVHTEAALAYLNRFKQG